MEVGRQITLWFIVCCVNVIYTGALADKESKTPPSGESSNRSELQTGNLYGIITADKNGTKLKLKIDSKVFWKNNKSIDSITCAVPAAEEKGAKGDKGENGTSGERGETGAKGDKGENGTSGERGETGAKGDKGDNGTSGERGEAGAKGDKGDNGTSGERGETGAKGDKGDNGTSGERGETGAKGDKGDNGTSGERGEMGAKGDKGYNGTSGERGETGERGISGAKGQQGEKGEQGICKESYGGSKMENYGQEENPAYSCSDIAENGQYYVNKAHSFMVRCDSYKTYIPNSIINSDFTALEKNKPVWLTSKNLTINQVYNMTIPDLSYLMATNVGFKLVLTYSDEVEILQILTWNGIVKSIPLSNGCQSVKKENDLEITCTPPNYLPLDFYIEAKKENVSIKLSLFFY